MRVYVDLVAVLNFFVDFLLILGTNRLSGFPPDWRRSLLASAVGGIYGGACLIPEFRFLGSFLWRTVALMIMALIAFGWNRSLVQRSGVFLLLCMALGGIASGMGKGNIRMLLVSVGLMWVLCRVSFRAGVGQREYIPVTLRWEDRDMTVIALKDTGNTLHDPLTGEQVLVAGADVGIRLLGLSRHQLQHPVETMASGVITGLRLIPYHAVGQPGSMLLAVRFTYAQVGGREAKPLVAFAPDQIAGGMYQMLAGGAV